MQAAVSLHTIVEDGFSKIVNCDRRLGLDEEPNPHFTPPAVFSDLAWRSHMAQR
jgi:hypothetical protein